MQRTTFSPRFRASLLLMAGVVALALHGRNPEPVPPATSCTKPQAANSEPARPLDMLTGDQAWEAHRAGTLFLDARLREDYRSGHIPGALNLPVWEKDFEARLTEFLTSPKADRKARMVVYCKGCCGTDSLLLAHRLQGAGFEKVQVYREGFPGWARAERPKTMGSSPNQMEVK